MIFFNLKKIVICYLLFVYSKNLERQTTNDKRPTSGFTLVELIIYMGLLMIMILIFTQIFASIIDNQLGSRNTSNTADDGRYIYSRFIYDVSRAQSITQPSVFGSSSATLTMVIGGSNYTYSLDNSNKLILTDAFGSESLNGEGSSVSALLFTKVGTSSAKPTIQMKFTIKGAVIRSGIVDQQDFQTTAGLR